MTTTPTTTVRDNDCGGCIDEDCDLPETCAYHSPTKVREFLAQRARQIEDLKRDVEIAKLNAVGFSIQLTDLRNAVDDIITDVDSYPVARRLRLAVEKSRA